MIFYTEHLILTEKCTWCPQYFSHCWPPLEEQRRKPPPNKPHAKNPLNVSAKCCKRLYTWAQTRAPQMIACAEQENGFSVLWPKSGTSSSSVATRIQSTYLFLEAKQSLQQGQMLRNGEWELLAGSAECGDAARHTPWEGARVPPQPPQPLLGADRCHPQIHEQACVPACGSRMQCPAPGSPASCHAASALGDPLPSHRDKGREQRKNRSSKCYLFWHTLWPSACFSPTANGSRVV